MVASAFPLAQDLRFALRTLAKSPLFTGVAVLSLALGIGANTAVFSLVDQVLLRMLPVKHPEELVSLAGRGVHYGSNSGYDKLSYVMYQDIRDRNQVFSGMFCAWNTNMAFSYHGRTQRIEGELVSGNYFPVLGVGAAAGRVFSASDDLVQKGEPYAVLSHRFWLSQFAGDPGIIGQKIVLNGYPYTVIGVSQAGFNGLDPARSPQVRVPIMMKEVVDARVAEALNPYSLNERRGRWVDVYGRLKPGVTPAQAKASLQPLFHSILEMEVKMPAFAHAADETRQNFLKMWMDATPAQTGRSQLRRSFSKPLFVLMGVVGLVLLIACANVANLLLARAAARQKEIAVRLAMGASRSRIIVQLLMESLTLAVAGGAAGVLLAFWMDRLLLGFLPGDETPLILSAVPDWRVLLFNFAVAFATGVIFGLAPALQSTNPDLAPTLKDQAGSVTSGTSASLRKMLVAVQVTLSLLLLIGAGLFVRSLQNLKDVDPGFKTRNLMAFAIDPTSNNYKPERTRQIYKNLLERLKQMPGVQSAALAIMPVLTGDEWDSSMTVEGYNVSQGQSPDPHMQFVSPGFFATMEIPLRFGRDFNDRDDTGAPKVAIVNEKFATKYFTTVNCVGRHIGLGSDPGTKTDITVIGVARDTRYESMRDEVPAEVYQPYRQMPFTLGMFAYVRTLRDPEQTFAPVRAAMRDIDPDVPVVLLRTLEKQMSESLRNERLVAALSTAFGLLATLLAAIGLYGVMAYTITRRTREIGIRMAIGAQSPDVVWLVMKEVLLIAGIGIACGLPAAYWLTRLVQSQLYGVQPADPVNLGICLLTIGLAAALAGYLPALRATRIDPMRALRWE